MKRIFLGFGILCMLTACSKEQTKNKPIGSPSTQKFEVGVPETYRCLLASGDASQLIIELGTDGVLDITSSVETASSEDKPATFILDDDVSESMTATTNGIEFTLPAQTFWFIPFGNPGHPSMIEGGGTPTVKFVCTCTGGGHCREFWDPKGKCCDCAQETCSGDCEGDFKLITSGGGGHGVLVRGLTIKVNGVTYGI